MAKESTFRDQFSQEKRSWIMSRVKGRDTLPEVKLRKELWHKGLRYQVQRRDLPGKPDLVFPRIKVAVFVDGAFWHGKKLSPERLGKMSPYWQEKIQNNIERDARNNKLLEAMGYIVLRFLDKDVLENTSLIATQIEDYVRKSVKKKIDASI